MGIDARGVPGTQEFPATSWTMIRRARQPGDPEATVQLERLVQLYWRPVYHVVRHSWRRGHDDARDLTQEFFATQVLGRSLIATAAPERGSFRALLRAALAHFMNNVVRDEGREKRGGGAVTVSIDADALSPDDLAADVATVSSPEELFDLAWKETVLKRAIAILERQLIAEGKGKTWEVFRRYELEAGRAQASYDELGRELALSGQQVKYALLLARAAFKAALTDVVREYVDGPEELAAELRSLFAR